MFAPDTLEIINNELIPAAIDVLMMLCTALTTWLFARAKNKRQLRAKDIDNEIKSADYYKRLLDDMSLRLDNAIQELMELEEKHRQLMVENRKLIEQLQEKKDCNKCQN
jgi:Na+/phosphate symporter